MGKAKNKTKNGAFRVPNRQCHARISFLYQAATYLANFPCHGKTTKSLELPESRLEDNELQLDASACTIKNARGDTNEFAASQYYSSHISVIARKAQFKIAPEMKRSICKGCSTVLITGSTSTSIIENLSRKAEKPWADVLLVSCNLCGMEKRYPLQPKGDRTKKQMRTTAVTEPEQFPA